jgi:hypothetical protein
MKSPSGLRQIDGVDILSNNGSTRINYAESSPMFPFNVRRGFPSFCACLPGTMLFRTAKQSADEGRSFAFIRATFQS